MKCCKNCAFRLDLKKWDYSQGGCVDTQMEGYVCLAFRDEGTALWMVGCDEEKDICECYEPKDRNIYIRLDGRMRYKCPDCKYFEYDESWDGEEETGIFICHKGHDDLIGWNGRRCDDFEKG